MRGNAGERREEVQNIKKGTEKENAHGVKEILPSPPRRSDRLGESRQTIAKGGG